MKYIITFAFCLIALFDASAQEYEWVKLKTEPYRGKQDDIYFINEQRGWYINGYGKIYSTSDGGQNWQMQFEKKGTFFRCIAFIDSLTGFVGTVGTEYFPNVTDTIPLYKTTDGGKTWQPVAYIGNYVKGLCAMEIVKEQFINHGAIGYKHHIYAVGRVGSPANFLVSHDNGDTFAAMDMSKYCAALYDIKMMDKNNGFACASTTPEIEQSNACILKTNDGGKTWSKVYQSTRPFENSWKMFFPTPKVGYATIQSYNPDTTATTQRFIKTTDGGATWKEYLLAEDNKARSFGVGFLDENIGYIGTMNTGYETRNGGQTWTKINLGIACNKIRILKKPDGALYGYAIGVNVLKLERKK